MRVLITGANGLLGANIARVLLAAGEHVTLFVRPNADLTGVIELQCDVIYGDIQDADDLRRAIAKVDAVVHAASTTDMNPHPFSYYEAINVNPTKNVIDAMLNSDKRLIYVSTANTFVPGTKEAPGTELNAINPQNYRSGYIRSKYIAQQLVLDAAEQKNLHAVVVNPTFMIGAYDAKPSSGKIILYGLRQGITWCPPGGKNFVSVRDVANGILHTLHHGSKGQCYLLTGENLSYWEFFGLLNQVIGRKQQRIVIPKFIMHSIGVFGTLLNTLGFKQVSFNLTNIRLLTIDNYYSGLKSKTAFNFEARPISDSIKEALAWFNTHGIIKKS